MMGIPFGADFFLDVFLRGRWEIAREIFGIGETTVRTDMNIIVKSVGGRIFINRTKIGMIASYLNEARAYFLCR